MNVIQIFCPGGLRHVDTWDYKPQLQRQHGQPFDVELGKQTFAGIGGNYSKSFWDFHQHGASGLWNSDLFPQLARHVDEIAFIYSMQSKSALHGPAMFMANSGFIRPGFPCMGAWVTYGLGSDCQDLPGFVVLNCGLIPPGGVDCFNSGFLPASYQGSIFRGGDAPVAAGTWAVGACAGVAMPVVCRWYTNHAPAPTAIAAATTTIGSPSP